MEIIQKQKGTMDLYGNDGKLYIYLTNLINELMEKYNYQYIKVPTFEASELFHRGVGETTDIVTKETYDFIDRGNRSITLRPEGTAGIVRAYIENKLYSEPNQPLKFYYIGSNFRYERPQAGRLREHTQFGIEVLGSSSVLVDAEIISIAVNLLKLIGLKGIKVKINTLGDNESRNNYKKELINFIKPYKEELCDDCKKRLEKNPLRILDCKIDGEKDVLKKCPKTIDFLNDESLKRFNALKNALDNLEIEYIVDTNLVRGLDYYNHTVFEVQAEIEGFGSQTALCGGGRYNDLVESLNGPTTPAMGFGMGLERLMLAIKKEEKSLLKNNQLDLYVINLCNEKSKILNLVNTIRLNGFKVETDLLDKNLKGQFKSIDRLNPKFLTVIGDDELNNNTIKIKDNQTKEETEISIDDIIDFLESR